MLNFTKENVLANTSGTWQTIGEICWTLATRMKRTITVSEVKRLLFQLADDGKIETHLRDDTLYYRKS